MKKGLIGKKIGMTLIFDENGNMVPVTVIEAGPCVVVQKKTTGIQLTGSMTIVYGTPTFKQMVRDYMTSGTPPYFTLQVTNNDPATSVGIQTIVFYNCRLNSGSLAQLDADADFLTEDIGFDFTSFEILSSFHDPAQLGGN